MSSSGHHPAPIQARVRRHLVPGEAVTARCIGERAGITTSKAADALSGLVAKGAVKRTERAGEVGDPGRWLYTLIG